MWCRSWHQRCLRSIQHQEGLREVVGATAVVATVMEVAGTAMVGGETVGVTVVAEAQ